jgi:2,3-bisphosphoglycerate-independent phosphoglycerate mutase
LTVKKVVLLVIDGMDTVNFTMADTPVMSGIHGRTAVGVAHTEIIGAGAALTPIAHAMMGTGSPDVVAARPGLENPGKCYNYFGEIVETVGDVARAAGLTTAAVGKNEAAVVLGGTGELSFCRLEKEGIDASDDALLVREILEILYRMQEGVLVATYGGVDLSGHRKNVSGLIEAVERADRMVGLILREVDLSETLVIIAADHGTNPMTGRHNTSPTPLSLITGEICGRNNLGVVHNLEIAATITGALGLRRPARAVGRDLGSFARQVAGGETEELDYQAELNRQLADFYRRQPRRHELIRGPLRNR